MSTEFITRPNNTTSTVGICTWTLGINDIDHLMAKIADLGLNAVQYCQPLDDYTPAEVKAAAARFDLEILIYDPFDCRPSDKNGEAGLAGAVEFYTRVVDYAAELGCGATLQGLSAWTNRESDEQAAWKQLVSSTRAICDYAKVKGVPLSYEPCNLYEVPLIHTAAEFQQLMDETGCNRISVLLDSFHMNLGEKDALATLREYGHKNSIYHLSDSNREGLGQGHIDFFQQYQALKEAEFNGPTVLEFVLQGNPVNTPPRNEQEMEELSRQIRHSLAVWRSYAATDNYQHEV